MTKTKTKSKKKTATKKTATKTAAKKPAKKRGRPKGSKTSRDVVVVEPSRCEKCDSTERSAYFGTPRVIEYASGGLDSKGKPFNRVVFRRCRCLSCGQIRQDKSQEYHPTKSKS